ncbi:uncharacterized protein LOC111261150 [Varroa jacobsoni]|uniref:uncharacterized protein LOC111261150 n=1 Tax=Varroa jacobsoni TaxID=62625 RepID=UPI000BF711DD|nr:uncharacterized protein LOC111261150 [Varroa jacobsoni]
MLVRMPYWKSISPKRRQREQAVTMDSGVGLPPEMDQNKTLRVSLIKPGDFHPVFFRLVSYMTTLYSMAPIKCPRERASLSVDVGRVVLANTLRKGVATCVRYVAGQM